MSGTYTARLRVRLAKSLEVEGSELSLKIEGVPVRVTGREPDDLRDSKWLILFARGFRTADEARLFGERLKAAILVASLECRLGVDVGDDRPTSVPSQYFIEKVRAENGVELRGNVHGLDVYETLENGRILDMNAELTVRTQVQPFFSRIAECAEALPDPNSLKADGLLLLNAALINPEPLAQLALAISAVEMMGQGQQWSEDQLALLERLRAEALGAEDVNPEEAEEVANAIARGLFRVGLRQGVMRVLNELGLQELRKEWDEVYGQRSRIIHGVYHPSKNDLAQLAHRAVSMCGRIVLRAAEVDRVPLGPNALQHF